MIRCWMPAKKRVLVLGGGPAGLATAFALSRTEALRAEFEVTVIESACRGIDVDGSLSAAWKEMEEAGVIRA